MREDSKKSNRQNTPGKQKAVRMETKKKNTQTAATDDDDRPTGSHKNSSIQNILDIWNILAMYATPENPLSLKEIQEKVAEMSTSDMVSTSTVKRYLETYSNGVNIINTLNPQTVLCCSDQPTILHTYVYQDNIHIDVDIPEECTKFPAQQIEGSVSSPHVKKMKANLKTPELSAPIWEGNMAALLMPSAINPIPPKTLDRKLPELAKIFSNIEELTQISEDMNVSTVKNPLRKRLPPLSVAAVVKVPDTDPPKYVEADGEKKKSEPRKFYLKSILSPSEWRILADMVKVYPYISDKQTKRFLSVLQRLAPGMELWKNDRYAQKQQAHIRFECIDTLDEAIQDGYLVNIRYDRYRLGIDADTKQLLPQLVPMPNFKTPGQSFWYKGVEPYAMMWSNGYYYLVCRITVTDADGTPKLDENGKPRKEMRNLRLDRIVRVYPTLGDDKNPIPFQRDKTFDPYKYRDRSPVMYPGEPILAQLRCPESLLSTLMDFFGTAIRGYTQPKEADTLSLEQRFTNVTIRASMAGIRLFVMQYADKVEVLEPLDLREEIRHSLQAALKKYQ